MPRRCGCASGSCSCVVQGGTGVTVSGSGSVSDPYIVNAEDVPLSGKLQVVDTDTVNLILNGQGTLADPYVLSAVATLALGDLTDVDDSNQTAGYVLARQPDNSFALVPPSTAPVGAITTDNTIDGDGSGGAPLSVHDYENIAFLDGADPANLPNAANLTLGDPTFVGPLQYVVERQAPAGAPFTSGWMGQWLTSTGSSLAGVWQVDHDGTPVAALRLMPDGRLLTSANGTDFHPIPFRTYADDIAINGTTGFATVPVTFPTDRFTQAPTVVVTPVYGGPDPVVATVSARSATGCNVRLARADGGALIGTFTVSLIAMQLTP